MLNQLHALLSKVFCTKLSKVEQARKHFSKLPLSQIPVGVCLLAEDSRLLECNPTLRRMLGLPLEGPINNLLTDFLDLLDGKRIFQNLEVTEHQVILLQVNGHNISARTTIRALKENGQVIGYVGFLVDVTSEERYEELFDRLPVGIYRVDANEKIVQANDALAKMLGYESRHEVEKRYAHEFYARSGEAGVFKDRVVQEKSEVKQTKELIKKGGQILFASVITAPIFSPNGRYEGRIGALRDVTNEEEYKRNLNEVGVGFYVVSVVDGHDIIRDCNKRFATILEYESDDELIGQRIAILYRRPEDYNRFKSDLLLKDVAGSPLLGYVETLRTRNGKDILVKVNSHLVRDIHGQIVGRTGILVDITQEERLRREFEILQRHLGQVLHSYTSTLLKVNHSIGWAFPLLKPDLFIEGKKLDLDEVEEFLKDPVTRVLTAIEAIFETVTPDFEKRKLPKEDWDELSNLRVQLQTVANEIQIQEFRVPFLRRIARRLIDICASLSESNLPREPIKRIVREAVELERIVCHVSLHQARAVIVGMDVEVAMLRDYLIANTEPKKTPQIIQLWSLVKQAMSNLKEFADSEGVALRPRNDLHNATVQIVERDGWRALSSLLHNAIKYSWSRAKGEQPWISIHAYIKDSNACVEFENYGVPVPQDEIESSIIFQLGYRGRLSGDRGRLGNGIGLNDARNIARIYGGEVTIESHPASRDASPDDYRNPFITKATLCLPLRK